MNAHDEDVLFVAETKQFGARNGRLVDIDWKLCVFIGEPERGSLALALRQRPEIDDWQAVMLVRMNDLQGRCTEHLIAGSQNLMTLQQIVEGGLDRRRLERSPDAA